MKFKVTVELPEYMDVVEADRVKVNIQRVLGKNGGRVSVHRVSSRKPKSKEEEREKREWLEERWR